MENVAATMSQSTIHNQWENDYRTDENAEFYDDCFDAIVEDFHLKPKAKILDVGCGLGAHSVRLADRGFTVTGIDFSQVMIDKALERNDKRIVFQTANILDLPYPSHSFDYVLCWGVLMHIPDVQRAIAEIHRVLKFNGLLIISEGNNASLQSVLFHGVKNVLNKEKAIIRDEIEGTQYWTCTVDGMLMTREASPTWLVQFLEEKKQMDVVGHFAGQFTEFYTRFTWKPIRRMIHTLNAFWFRYVRHPRLAFGNIVIAEKKHYLA